MSRVGKHPVVVPAGVDVVVVGQSVTVKGKLGELKRTLPPEVEIALENGIVRISPRDDGARARAMWGTSRSLVNSMVSGVSEGFTVGLEIVGVGYRAEVAGSVLKLHVGFAKPAEVKIPAGIKVEVRKPTRAGIDGEVDASGIDKELVGQFAANVRRVRPPDLYKGKGIRYRGEYVRKLAGKAFGSGAGP